MSDELASYVYEHRVAPDRLVKAGIQGRPQLWIFGGENGVGKSTSMDRMALRLRAPTQKINQDDLAEYVVGYHDLAAKDPALAQEEAGDYTSDWCDRLRASAADIRSHIFVETSSPAQLEDEVEFAENHGYETGLYVIAEPKEISWTAAVDRTDKALKRGHIGTNAIVSDRGHGQRYAAWPRAIFDAERRMQFDHIVIARRDGAVVYRNQRQERAGVMQWANKPQGLEALLLERHRGLGPAEIDWLKTSWERLAASSQLKADRFMKTIPLRQHQADIVGRADSEGNRFDPFQDNAALARQGAREWRDYLIKDLNLIKSSRDQLGSSAQFDQHIDRYAAALIDLAFRPPQAPIRRLGQTLPSTTYEDRSPTVTEEIPKLYDQARAELASSVRDDRVR